MTQQELYTSLKTNITATGLIQNHGGIDFNFKSQLPIGYLLHDGNRYAICKEKELACKMPINTGYACYMLQANKLTVLGA